MSKEDVAREFDGLRKTGPDVEIEAAVGEHCRTFGIDPLTALKLYPVLVRRQWLKRLLAHLEMFKMTLDVPGDIADLGVFRGWTTFLYANLLESYCIGDRTKIVYGFDNWSGFTEIRPEDGQDFDQMHKVSGGFSPARYAAEVREAIRLFDQDRFVPWKARIVLVDGHIEESVPKFLREFTGIRFSLVHFDCDLYKPTKIALEAIWPNLSRGGVVMFDEYAVKEWAGETKAVDEFFADKPEVRVRKTTWTNSPQAYVIKP